MLPPSQLAFDWLLPVVRRRPPRAWRRPRVPRAPRRAPRPRRRPVPSEQAPISWPRPDWRDGPLAWVIELGRRRRRGEAARPKTRGECDGVPRPCPFVGCRHHLWIWDAGEQLDHQPVDPGDLEHSCALDIADEVAAKDRVVNLHDLGVLMRKRKETVLAVNREATQNLRNALEEGDRTL